MTPNLLVDYLRLHDESALRERIRSSLIDWALEVMRPSGVVPSAHHRLLLNDLELLSRGEVKRLMVLMPPGSAKSTYASVIFPIWWFIQRPQSSVIAASHTAALVELFSRRIQTLIDDHRVKLGYGLLSEDRSVSRWRTDTGGEYFAVGVRGAVTGRRADLAIIDDPIKSMAEADSAKHRQHVWDWYTAELTTRLKPDARILLVMTRWHEQDLGGQLIARDRENWRILRLPAIAEELDPIGRPPGAPLWPEWESLKALEQKRSLVGSRVWSALFQQAPHPREGRLFRIGRLETVTANQIALLTMSRVVRAWDLAATSETGMNNPDWTVGLKLALTEQGRYVVEDVIRLRGGSRAVEDAIIATAHSDGHSVIVSLPMDPGQAGKAQIAHLSSLLAGYRVYSSREQGSKVSRAMPVAAQIEAGNFAIRQATWLGDFTDELSSFPESEKDDQVDALSRAFITISDFQSGSRRITIPFNIR